MTGDELETLLARVRIRSEALIRWQEAVECMMSLSKKEHMKPGLLVCSISVYSYSFFI